MKFLFVGLGAIGQRHLRNLQAIMDDGDVIYAYRQRGLNRIITNELDVIESSLSIEEYYNIKSVNSLDEAWEIGMDAVFISNPTSLHYSVIKECVFHKTSFFVEKPVWDFQNKSDELELEAASKQLITMVGYQYRYHPCIIQAKQWIDNNAIGFPISAAAEYGEDVSKWHKYEDYTTSYSCNQKLGGGVLLTQIHELDYISYIWGHPQSVYAIGGKYSDMSIDVDDTVDLLIKNRINQTPIHIHLDYLQYPPVRTFKLVGEGGRIEGDLVNNTVSIWSDQKQELQYQLNRNEMYQHEIKEFIECLKLHKQTSIPFSEGMKSYRLAQAAWHSLNTNRVINIE